MGREQDKYPTEWALIQARIRRMKDALRDLLRECDEADHWLRHTQAFCNATLVMKDEDKTE